MKEGMKNERKNVEKKNNEKDVYKKRNKRCKNYRK